jgi:hypothetical protein
MSQLGFETEVCGDSNQLQKRKNLLTLMLMFPIYSILGAIRYQRNNIETLGKVRLRFGLMWLSSK